MTKFLRRYSITKRNTSAMEPETVPDTDYTIFTRVKIGKSIGVYSANTRNKYGVYRVYGVFGDLLCAAGRIPAV